MKCLYLYLYQVTGFSFEVPDPFIMTPIVPPIAPMIAQAIMSMIIMSNPTTASTIPNNALKPIMARIPVIAAPIVPTSAP